jgi:hypothetical protein
MTQFEKLTYGLYGLAASAVILTLLVLLLIFANRRRLQRKPQLSDTARLEYQAALLETIKKASANQGTVVDVRPFWRGSGVKPYQRKPVIQPLIEDGHVTVQHPPAENAFFETLRDIWKVAMYRPPTHLVLTDRTWTWMVHERISGERIIIGKVETLNWQNAGGDIASSPQTNAGRDAHVRADHSTRKAGVHEGVPLELVTDLVAALRSDAPSLPDTTNRTRVRELANKLEQEVEADPIDEDVIEDGIGRAERYVGRAGGLMATTAKALEAWHALRGST